MSLPPDPNQRSPGPAMPDPRDPRTTEVIDAPLIALANWSGGDHRKFLYAFFSFLHRRTDFYLVPHPDDVKDGKNNTKMGFSEGDAEKLLLAAFRQFPLRRMPKQKDQVEGSINAEGGDDPKAAAIPSPKEPQSLVADKDLLDPMHGVRYNEEKKQIPVGNGGSTPVFKWTQNLEECTVLLPVPPDCSRGKDLVVDIQSKHIRVKAKATLEGDTEPRSFLSGDLTEPIKPGESTWSIESGILTLILFKQKKTFWKAVFSGDEEIDTTLVDSRRHIQDYDESTQAQIRKIMHQQSLIQKAEIMVDTSKPETIPSAESLPAGVEFMDVAKMNLN